MFWICLKVQLVRQTDGLGVGEDERGRRVWDNSQLSGFSDLVSNGAILQDGEHSRKSRICGEKSSHLRCVKCGVSADWICWMYGSGAQGRNLGRDHRYGTM